MAFVGLAAVHQQALVLKIQRHPGAPCLIGTHIQVQAASRGMAQMEFQLQLEAHRVDGEDGHRLPVHRQRLPLPQRGAQPFNPGYGRGHHPVLLIQRNHTGQSHAAAPALFGRGAKALPPRHPFPPVLPGHQDGAALGIFHGLGRIIVTAPVQFALCLWMEPPTFKIHLPHQIHGRAVPGKHGGKGQHPLSIQLEQVRAFPHAAQFSARAQQNPPILPAFQIGRLVKQGAAFPTLPCARADGRAQHQIPRALVAKHTGVAEIRGNALGAPRNDRVARVLFEGETAVPAGGKALGLHRFLPVMCGACV